MRKRKGELVQLEDAAIEIRSAICCGVLVYWAELPGSYIDRRGVRRKTCCEESSHGSKAAAVECARTRIAAGLEYPMPGAIEGVAADV